MLAARCIRLNWKSLDYEKLNAFDVRERENDMLSVSRT